MVTHQHNAAQDYLPRAKGFLCSKEVVATNYFQELCTGDGGESIRISLKTSIYSGDICQQANVSAREYKGHTQE